MKNSISPLFFRTSKIIVVALFFILAACSSDDGPKNNDIVSGVIKVEVTYPDNFMDYQLEVTSAVTSYDVTKIDVADFQFDYLNDPDFVATDDPDNFLLVPGSTTHIFQTANYAVGLGMLIASNNTDVDIEEGVSVNLKIFLNNSLQEEVDLVTERGGFDFTWTPVSFIYDEN